LDHAIPEAEPHWCASPPSRSRYTPGMTASRETQAWFSSAIAREGAQREMTLDGTRIAYQSWGSEGLPLVVLVHGYAAHSRWWDFIAPWLADDWHVVALDLAGAGDSDHREHYSSQSFASEILAVARIEARGAFRPIVVGHSFGGAMARVAAFRSGDEADARSHLAGLVLVDSIISSQGARPPPPMPRSRTRYYSAVDDAIRRFRLRPPQPISHPFIIEYIARHSVRMTDEGAVFKADQTMFARMRDDLSLPDAVTMIRRLTCPVRLVYGENSRFFQADRLPAIKALLAEQDRATIHAGTTARTISVPDACHHVFLDQPIAFVQALRGVLSSLREETPIQSAHRPNESGQISPSNAAIRTE
jgi:pimeloyl-ACP methyl ester carboxylesterase